MNNEQNNQDKYNIYQSSIKWQKVIFVMLVIICIILFTILPIKIGLIIGESMEPTYKTGDLYLGISETDELKRDDVVVAYSKGLNECLIKRIIGMPGETIDIKDNKIYIDNIYYENEGGTPLKADESITYPITLGKNQYFVMGDNREVSLDSRSVNVGAIYKRDIKSKIVYGGNNK